MKRLEADQLHRFRQEVQHGPAPGLSSYPHPRLMPRLLGVPHGLDGPGRAQLDLPGPVQPLPAQPRHQGHQPAAASTRSSVTARWASPSRSARSAWPRARSSTTSRSSSTATSSSSTARSAATARSSRSWSRTSAGAGWNVIKVVWGREWDALLAQDVDGALVNQMNKHPRRPVPDLLGRVRRLHPRALLRCRRAAAQDGRGHERPRDRAAAARRPRLPQGVRRLRRRVEARRAADRDPRPHHQGLDDRRPGGQERHPPDEEAERRDAQGVPRPARPADHRPGHRRALRGRTARRRSTTRARAPPSWSTCATDAASWVAASPCGGSTRAR